MRSVGAATASLILLCGLLAGATPPILPQELEPMREEGFAALFNLHYAQAIESFEAMTRTDPRHPAGYVYLANARWLEYLSSIRRLQSSVYSKDNTFFSETDDVVDPNVDREFISTMSKAASLAREMLKADPNDMSALYYLGMSRTITATYEATVKRSFFSALKNASKGVDLNKKVLARDPSFSDAYLSIGAFNYVIGSLPFLVKVLVFFGGVQGSKREGLLQLETAAKDATFVRDEARVVLIMFYDREKKRERSLELLQELSKQYPDNYLFTLQTGSTLATLGRYEESFRAFEGLLGNSVAMDYMQDLIHYQYAEALAAHGVWQKAYDEYLLSRQSPKAPESLVTMAYLGAGKCLDALGKREQAVNEYQTVLKRRNVYSSHQAAQKLVKKPFRGSGS